MNQKKVDDIKEKSVESSALEHCVMCGRVTDVPVTMPIELRKFYEIGCGQLCAECHKKLRD